MLQKITETLRHKFEGLGTSYNFQEKVNSCPTSKLANQRSRDFLSEWQGEMNICFSKIQLVGKKKIKNSSETSAKRDSTSIVLVFKVSTFLGK